MSKPPLRILSSNRGEGLNEVEQIDKAMWEISPRADKSAPTADPVILLKVNISLLSGA